MVNNDIPKYAIGVSTFLSYSSRRNKKLQIHNIEKNIRVKLNEFSFDDELKVVIKS